MRRQAAFFVECVLRGSGQLFIANRPGSGFLFLLGLTLVSPLHAGLALLGAAAITLAAGLAGASPKELRTGLFGVNGALAGFAWILCPELSPWLKVLLTIVDALCIAAVLVPLTMWLARRKLPLTLFALPSVLAVWASIAALQSFGLYDRHCLAAWADLAARRPQQAFEDFEAAAPTSPRALALAADGRGWAAFQLEDYPAARERFEEAAKRLPDIADAYDGLGWSCLKLDDFDAAETAFRAAVARDPFAAGAWNGLGWTLLETGDEAEARSCFRRALLAAPLLADAYAGLGQDRFSDTPDSSSTVFRSAASFLRGHVSAGFQYATSGQLICWLLFGLGILHHSRIAALAAAITIALCVVVGYLLPSLTAPVDMSCTYNLLALVLALSGHYLRLCRITLAWTIVAAAGMVLAMALLSGPMTRCGMPPLSLPCSVFLTGTLIFFHWLAPPALRNLAAPLEIAVTSPENARLWFRKREIVEQCWRKLRDARLDSTTALE